MEEKELWKKSVDILNELKSKLIEEGNLALYEGRIKESTREIEFSNMERKSRYLYHAWL